MASPNSKAVAVLLTHRRPRLATAAVQLLVGKEGFAPQDVIVVVNGEGGLDDPSLEAACNVVRLPENLGPAGGFRAGIEHARDTSTAEWFYIVEDDISLLDLPVPRVQRLIGRIAHSPQYRGAIVAFGRDLMAGRGITRPHIVRGEGSGFEPVDVAAWGATLLSRSAVELAGAPDDAWFFGFEDFDFFIRLRAAGLPVLVDTECKEAQERVFFEGRQSAIGEGRPRDDQEPWRQYYFARNFFELARRHGHLGWTVWHLLYSLRRLQLMASGEARRAYLRGLFDGARGHMGRNNRFLRETGEW